MTGKSEERKTGFRKQALLHLDSLLRTALFMTDDLAKANDIIQETYVHAYRISSDIEDKESNYRTRLFKIMTGLLRKCQPPHAPSSEMDGYTEIELETIDENEASVELDETQYNNLCRDVGDDTIIDAIRELPEDLRFITILSFVEGFSYPEISEITDTEISAVKSKLRTARQLLQRLLISQFIKSGLLKEYPAYC
jgi:RNA polymerase sigma-70 factor (ECF subfamily)